MVLGTALHRHLISATILFGALFMLSAHLLSMFSVAGSQMPVNVICSILGAPLVMVLIIRNRNLLLD
jgi:iron complex transport system permease protein